MYGVCLYIHAQGVNRRRAVRDEKGLHGNSRSSLEANSLLYVGRFHLPCVLQLRLSVEGCPGTATRAMVVEESDPGTRGSFPLPRSDGMNKGVPDEDLSCTWISLSGLPSPGGRELDEFPICPRLGRKGARQLPAGWSVRLPRGRSRRRGWTILGAWLQMMTLGTGPVSLVPRCSRASFASPGSRALLLLGNFASGFAH